METAAYMNAETPIILLAALGLQGGTVNPAFCLSRAVTLYLLKIYIFKSPSAVVNGRSAIGTNQWKLVNGTSYKEWEVDKLGQAASDPALN